MATYFDKLKDPRWQKKRLECLNNAQFTCKSCGATDKTLHVHHRQYLKGSEPWEYEDAQLEVLCESCHKEHHAEIDKLQSAISYVSDFGETKRSRDEIASFIVGACEISSSFDVVSDPSSCILGQIYADFPIGLVDCASLLGLLNFANKNPKRLAKLIKSLGVDNG